METEKLIERLRQERASLELDFAGVNAIVFDVAADALTTMQDREATLIRAAEVFARCPVKGKNGGRFVIAKAIYDDGDVSPREAHWHMSDFEALREALGTSGLVERS